jgi:hypothetical protein
MTDAEIAAKIGVTERSICNWRREAGMPPKGRRPHKLPGDAELLALLAGGETRESIAARFGATVAGVYYRVRAACGHPRAVARQRRPRREPEGLTYEDVPARFLLAETFVEGWARERLIRNLAEIGDPANARQGASR